MLHWLNIGNNTCAERIIISMINLQKQDDDIVKRLKYVNKDGCPNVFISGRSLSAMEKLGMRMVEKLEEQQVLRFKGICKHFTILMPYYNNHQEAISFMNHLLNSISIARDCYDSYCGFVLIEAVEEWGKEGSNEYLELFYEYIRSETQIKFFLLFPESESTHELDHIFAEFASCGACIRVKSELPTVHQCVSEFKRKAVKNGYNITEDVEQYLYQRLKEREVQKVNNADVIDRLMEQIVFEKGFKRNKDKTIDVVDVKQYLPEIKKKAKIPIGFAR